MSNNGSKDYWKSIKDYSDGEELKTVKKNEFLEGVTDEFEPDKLNGMSRRKFLAVLGASTAFAATACSDYRDKGEIVPYSKRPKEILPGVANYYASTCTGCSNACSSLVKTREGRPIKIDGNPDSPINKGKLCTKGQSSILNLYDPERLQNPLKNGQKISWSVLNNEILSALQNSGNANKEIVLFAKQITSPTYNNLLNEFVASYPTTQIISYSQFNNLNRLNAWEKCYGNRSIPSIEWNNAKIILSLESDFLGKEGNYVENMRLFSESRDVIEHDDMSRLYVAEGGLSLTGMNADYKIKIKPNDLFSFSLALLNEVGKKLSSDISIPDTLKNEIRKHDLKSTVVKYNLNEQIVNYLVDDLINNPSESIVYAGDSASEEVHIVVNLINEILANKKLYNFDQAFSEQRKLSSEDELQALVKRIEEGNVGAIIFIESDPVYQLTSYKELADAVSKVALKISLTESVNDTSSLCDYVLPINNALESWGDHHVRTGVVSLQQPVISPIFNTKQKEAILLSWVKKVNKISDQDYHLHLQNSFKEYVYNKENSDADFRTYWLSTLHDGVVEIGNTTRAQDRFSLADFSPTIDTKSEWTAHIQESYFIGAGEFANNGWLQEIPHPVTKVTWDNYAAVAPATAKEINVENGDIVKITTQSGELEIPVMIQPGLAEKHFTIETGNGRRVVGDVGKDSGFNSNKIDQKDHVIILKNVSKTGKNYKLVSTQEHHSLDNLFIKDLHKKRHIIQEGTLEEYHKHPDFLKENKPEVFSITSEHKYEGHKWAMAIDLNKCVSCAACVSSCNVENNVPVVGKDQVAVGREMQWMRIDRYYSGTPEEPIPSNQPMLCQHCDNAPCENVCPVNATNHSPDGLNQMVYNRCVGTRYCSNNCPYKVRRFNFFDFRDHFKDEYYDNELTYLVNNPEVTVRSRGVMEKCTFCVQRIMEVRSEAIKDGREIRTDEIKTACQTACPAEAIVFGDANNPDSKVSKLREHGLGYHVLEELNVKPNVTYIAKLRNTRSEAN